MEIIAAVIQRGHHFKNCYILALHSKKSRKLHTYKTAAQNHDTLSRGIGAGIKLLGSNNIRTVPALDKARLQNICAHSGNDNIRLYFVGKFRGNLGVQAHINA